MDTLRCELLLVEDDPMLARAVAGALAHADWRVAVAPDAPAARLALVDHRYAAVLLDLGLPGGSGLQVLREACDTTPVIILTARDALSDRVAGLDAGADDYLVKPFQMDEFAARLRAMVRRARGRVAPRLQVGEVEIDPARRVVTRAGTRVALSLHEYRTLMALLAPATARSRARSWRTRSMAATAASRATRSPSPCTSCAASSAKR